MNKIFKFLFILLSFSQIEAMENSLVIRSAAFFPSSKRFREIYEDVGVSYQIEASRKFNYFEGWVNFDWFSKHGESIGFNDPTRVRIANTSFGIKFPYQLGEYFTVYVGIGPSFSTIWLKNESMCTHERLSRLAFGGVLKADGYYFITERIFLDVFVDYLYQPVHFKTHVDIGGIKTGMGVGVKF